MLAAAVMLGILSAPDASLFVAAFGLLGVVIQQNAATRKAVQAVRAETRPNGGSSLRDDVVAVKNAVARLEGAVGGLYHRHDELDRRLSAVEDYITNPKETK